MLCGTRAKIMYTSSCIYQKHHYRELPEQLQASLGRLPDGFVDYFIGRFPQLLVHTYRSIEVAKHEQIFEAYY